MKKLIIITVVTSLITISCLQSERKSGKVINMIVNVDLSDSRDSTVIRWYKEVIKNSILKKMGPKDQVTVLPIDYNTQLSGVELFRLDLSRYEFGNEYAGLQAKEVERSNLRDSLSVASIRFDTLFETAWKNRTVFHKGTDITGALRESNKYMKEGFLNVVVLLSDMQHYTDKIKVNFEDSLNTESDISRYLSKVDTTDLNGVQILVLTGAQNKITIEKYNTIKGFWEQYFIRSHGELIDYSSGAVSQLEEIFE